MNGKLSGLLSALACWTVTTTAFAGGLYLNDRGARPLARAGAFVAGADDGSAVWYNPAGLVETKNGFLADGTLTFFKGDFTREINGVEQPTATAKNQKLPIPTLAITHDFGTRRAMFAAGVLAPNVVLMEWPSEVSQDAQRAPAPQRYSLYSMRGSIAANVFFGAGVKLFKGLSLGADVQLVLGQLKLNTALSACDGTLCAFPEQPEYDANATVRLPVVNVTAVVGATYEWGPLRLGASVMTPYAMKGSADLDVALPPAAIFDDAEVQGSKANMRVDFPLIARAGIQVEPFEALQVEFAFVWEQWSRQEQIQVTPQNVTITDVTGIGNYEVGPITIPREMQDVYSFRLGGELALGRTGFSLLGGIALENGAFQDAYLSPITMDSDKLTIGGGLSFQVGSSVRFDMSLAHTFLRTVRVDGTSRVPRPNAIRPTAAEPDYITNGSFDMRATVLGIGLVMYP